MVFDSSGKEEKGEQSANCLEVRVMLNHLVRILLTFRTSEYVILTGIEIEFLQVEITKKNFYLPLK
uniref:Uncharacterized protein n=1 Tax=Parascaris equorum TaxID=6256 RepID=A0A914S2G2_PAREQ